MVWRQRRDDGTLTEFSSTRHGAAAGRTPLMVAAPTVALDLPLKILVYEDSGGAVWVGYNTPDYLAERHSVPADLLANIGAVRGLAGIAAGAA